MISSGQFARLMFIYFAAAICTSAQTSRSVVPTTADIVARMAKAQAENRDNVRHISSRGTTNYSA